MVRAMTVESNSADLGLPWLVGDVGGTNARLGWVPSLTAGVTHVRTLPTAGFDGPAAAVRAYLADMAASSAPAVAVPGRAALAVASTISGDAVELTNSHWRFSSAQLQAELGLRSLRVLNDFEALALSLPRLGPTQWRAHGLAPNAQGVLAVIGPGTGLGVAGLVQTAHGWCALASEGGHATLSAADDFEGALLAHARRTHEHVSAERLLSGIGLPDLHQAVAAVLGQPATRLRAKDIVDSGMGLGAQGVDALCERTLDVFCALLGGFAGNVALTLGAHGGVYIGGGIVPRLGERFYASAFRQRFEAKGRFRALLQTIPTAVITDTLAALSGAQAAIEQQLTLQPN